MKFCPKCEARLKKDSATSILSCPTEDCTYTEGGPKIEKQSVSQETGTDFLVWWMLQTRSADEPTTQFFRCTKCQHTWRNYA